MAPRLPKSSRLLPCLAMVLIAPQKKPLAAMKILFLAWRNITLATAKEAWQSEALRLREMLGKRVDSIWHMNRGELARKAQEDLGMSLQQVNRETVTTLREKLRRARVQVKEEADPLLQVPKGLERMNVDTLIEQCILRQLDISPLPGTKGHQKTRPQMIVAIREDVEVRVAEAAAVAAREKKEAVGPPPEKAESDWNMT